MEKSLKEFQSKGRLLRHKKKNPVLRFIVWPGGYRSSEKDFLLMVNRKGNK